MKSKIVPISGDASFRKFYRFISGKKSKIIVLTSHEKYQNIIAYSAINDFLRSNKILTPKLYFCDYKKGIMIVEDFGDLSFYKILKKTRNRFKIYKRLVDLLLRIQKIKVKSKLKSISNKSHRIKKYSRKILFKESDLFFDWYLPLIMSKQKAKKTKKESRKILLKLYNGLNFTNSFLVHRDYHVQNLMKVGNKIGVIDTQDALIGNPAYDLVSLIDDVRIKTSYKLKNLIYNYYIKNINRINEIDQKKFLKDFNVLSVQRSLKIIGIFSRLCLRDNKKQYLKLIPYAWKLLEIRTKSKTFLKLKKILDKNITKKVRKKIITK